MSLILFIILSTSSNVSISISILLLSEVNSNALHKSFKLWGNIE